MNKILISLFSFLSLVLNIGAQELNATLNFNTKQVQSVDAQMASSLEEAIKVLLTEQKWTDATLMSKEKIDCIVAIAVTDMPTANSFKSEIQITARRPVYNSSYVTTTLNFKDNEFDFSYTLGEPLDYNSYSISNNLIATIAFYSYVIIGLDFDSFSLHGGRPYFEKAMDIANSVQSMNASGWKPFSGKMNRYDLAVALTEEGSKHFHEAWYNYHRLGLDIMESNVTRGRLKIVESIASLEKLYETRPSSPLLALFAESKLTEIVRACSNMSADDKKSLKEQLLRLFPAKSKEINELK